MIPCPRPFNHAVEIVTPGNEAFLRDLVLMANRYQERLKTQLVHYFTTDGELREWSESYCRQCANDTHENCPHINAMLVNRPDDAIVYVPSRATWHCTEFARTPRKVAGRMAAADLGTHRGTAV